MNSKNTRKTLIGTFIGMMALTAASAATAGVAWFTTTRTANVTFHSASVSSNRGELKVGELGTAPNAAAYAADEHNPAFKSKMDAISSYDGVNFYNALLDVDGSELGIYLKDATPTIAEFGFSAGTQAVTDTELSIFLAKMDIKVTDVQADKLVGNGEDKEISFTKTPLAGEDAEMVVKINGQETTEYERGDSKITLDSIPRADDPATADVVDPDQVTVEYRYKVADNDPILNSIRVALFASNEEDAIEDIAVEENETLVWDTTHADAEVHSGITVTAEDATHTDEKHYVRKASERFIDLDYAIDANDTDEKITAITLKHGDAADADISGKVSVSGRRVTITDDELAIARGDLITVSYIADTVAKKEDLANAASKIDGYYAGKDLVDEYDGEDLNPNEDGDLTSYGAYLGETNNGAYLNVVVRAWIEGTDANHDEEGSEWEHDTEDSIDITGHNYKVAFDLALAAIDANVA